MPKTNPQHPKSKSEQNWLTNYELLKAYIATRRHLPNKRKVENRGLLNWWKYNQKLIRQGKLDNKRVSMLQTLSDMRDMQASSQPAPPSQFGH